MGKQSRIRKMKREQREIRESIEGKSSPVTRETHPPVYYDPFVSVRGQYQPDHSISRPALQRNPRCSCRYWCGGDGIPKMSYSPMMRVR